MIKYLWNCIHVEATLQTLWAKDHQSNTRTWKSIQIEYSTWSSPQNQLSQENDLLLCSLSFYRGSQAVTPLCFIRRIRRPEFCLSHWSHRHPLICKKVTYQWSRVIFVLCQLFRVVLSCIILMQLRKWELLLLWTPKCLFEPVLAVNWLAVVDRCSESTMTPVVMRIHGIWLLRLSLSKSRIGFEPLEGHIAVLSHFTDTIKHC